MTMVPFSKYCGCGNDFILIDNRSLFLPSPPPKTFVNLVCQRKFGIGADGLILLEPSQKADHRMRIFNADGSEAEMCGNGIRCLGQFLQDLGIKPCRLSIETMNSVILIEVKDRNVCVQMPSPSSIKEMQLTHEGVSIPLHFLDTGVPHSIIFVEDLHKNPYAAIAPALRHHPVFSKGSNINLAKILSRNAISMRTFERGVEEETLACGTGAVATAIAANRIHGLKAPITIHTRSQETLLINFTEAGTHVADVTMSGPAFKIFQGQMAKMPFLG